MLGSCGVKVLAFYGSAKTPDAIERKISAASGGSRAELDLFDVNRFRVVTSTLPDMMATYHALDDRFGSVMVRCRNYYREPRRGSMDPYRAVHLCLRPDDEEFVEIQLMTGNRDSVGLLDHAFVHKRTSRFVSEPHRRWLQILSWTANVADAQILG